jgi:hypothetical protein
LLLIREGRVVYKLSSGQPNLDQNGFAMAGVWANIRWQSD